jgi:hypothetical protein
VGIKRIEAPQATFSLTERLGTPRRVIAELGPSLGDVGDLEVVSGGRAGSGPGKRLPVGCVSVSVGGEPQ